MILLLFLTRPHILKLTKTNLWNLQVSLIGTPVLWSPTLRLFLDLLMLLSVKPSNFRHWSHWSNFIDSKSGPAITSMLTRYDRPVRGDQLALPFSKLPLGKSYRSRPLRKHEQFALFSQFWQLSRPKSNSYAWTHRDFRHMGLKGVPHPSRTDDLLVNASYFFSRWSDTHNLLFNLLYAAPIVQLLANKSMLEETLVFNWQYSIRDYKLFKFTQPFFAVQDGLHGESIHKSMHQLLRQRLDFAIIADLQNHLVLTNYFQRYNIVTVGLVPTSYSPWRVSFPVPSISDSNLVQLFFTKWVIAISASARTVRTSEKFQEWKVLSREKLL